MDAHIILKWILSTVTTIITQLFNVSIRIFYILLILMVLDYVSGVFLSICKKKVSSKIGFVGIFKKFMIIIIVSVCQLLSQFILDDQNVVGTVVMVFYISNECISIIENATAIGLPIPQKIVDVLDKLKDK